MNTVELFEEEVSKLPGKECWGVVGGVGSGSIISLSIGDKYPKAVASKNRHLSEIVRNNDSEFSLLIECPWRIESSAEVLCGSHHSNEKGGRYLSSFKQITGIRIESIECNAPAFDLKVLFSNGITLIANCCSIGVDENECYSFGTPKGWFSVCFDGVVSLEPST